MRMSAFNHESREKFQRKRQRVETETPKITQAYLAKQISLPLTQLICKTPLLILKPQGMNSARV